LTTEAGERENPENKRVKNFMADKINIELDDGNLQ